MAMNRETILSTEGEEVLGNGANRFDAHRQSGTIPPPVESPDDAPPETGGGAPRAD